MNNLSISNKQSVLNSLTRTNKSLTNVQTQIASGLKNPNPSTNPSASILAKGIESTLAITKKVQEITQQASNTLRIADTILIANTEILNQMRTQALQAINGTNNNQDRENINISFQENLANITENATAKWGSRTLLDGTFSMNCQTSATIQEAIVTGSPIIADALDVGDLVINGQDIGVVNGGAKEIAASINHFSITTQVTASALTSATGVGDFSGVEVNNPIIIINNIAVPLGGFSGAEHSNQIVNRVVEAINLSSELASQNIMAKNVGGVLQVNATDGSELSIDYENITEQNVLGPLPGVYTGSVVLSSVLSITVGGNNPGNAGLESGVIPASGVAAVTLGDMRSEALFGTPLPDVLTPSNAQAALAAIDQALNQVLGQITEVAATVNRLENIQENMADTSLSLHDSLSAIQDVDYSEALMNSASLQAIKEAGIAVLKSEMDSDITLGHLVKDSLQSLRGG